MPFIDQPDFSMYYEMSGSGSETILLLHGNLASVRWWDKYLPHLPPGFRAVAIDLRGCGCSGRTAAGYTIAQFAEDVHFFTQQLNLTKFHLIGHSMGGQIALLYALQHPGIVKTVTLLDSVPASGLRLDDDARAAFDVLMTDKAVLQQAIHACMQYSDDHAFVERACNDAFHCAPQVFTHNPVTMANTGLLDKVQSIDVPVLLIHGCDDLIIPIRDMDATIQAMPFAQVVIFEQCGHSPQIEYPEKFSEVFNNFINKYPI